MRKLRHRESTTKIIRYSGYGSWKMKADIAGSILLVVLQHFFLLILYFAKARNNRANRHPEHRNRRPSPQPSYLSQIVLGHKLMKQILRQIQPAMEK